MSKAFDSLMEGLKEALDFAQGKASGAVVRRIKLPDAEAASIRPSKRLSSADEDVR